MRVHAERRDNPDAAVLEGPPAVAGVPLLEDLRGEVELAAGAVAPGFLERGVFENFSGEEDDGAEQHRFAEEAVRGIFAGGVAAAIALGPAGEAVGFLDGALAAVVGPVHEAVNPLSVASSEIAIVVAIEKGADEPAEFLARFRIAVTGAGFGYYILLPASEPVAGPVAGSESIKAAGASAAKRRPGAKGRKPWGSQERALEELAAVHGRKLAEVRGISQLAMGWR